MKRDISSSLTRGINAKRLCNRLKSKDGQMCELKYAPSRAHTRSGFDWPRAGGASGGAAACVAAACLGAAVACGVRARTCAHAVACVQACVHTALLVTAARTCVSAMLRGVEELTC